MQEANQRNQVKCCLEVFMIPTADSTELSQGVPLMWLPLSSFPPCAFYAPKAVRHLGMPGLPSLVTGPVTQL